MVTPRKPDARRGAPPIAWRDDPDRYAVALIAALDTFKATSMRQSALLAALLMLDKHVGEVSPKALQRRPGKTGDAYEKITGPGESITTEEGRAHALRKKWRLIARDPEADPEASHWIVVMAGIFMLLMGAKDWDRVRYESLLRAAGIGEQAFVRDLVLRLQPPVI